eukprot:1665912-Prorocentrum_lima.AAC.1
MTSSLVGSEMCIRDSCWRRGLVGRGGVLWGETSAPAQAPQQPPVLPPVSYTHLTLPTSVDLGGR